MINMKIFGYDKNDEEFDNIMELSQATLSCKKDDLDSIIDFLNEVRDEIKNANIEDEYHLHYRDYNTSWKEEESDLIVSIDK